MRIARFIATACVVGLLAGCGGGSTGTTSLRPADAVRRASLAEKDLPAAFGPDDPGMGADELTGSTSLELCWPTVTYRSERRRLARHYANFAAPGSSSLGNEVVAYQRGGVKQAMKELRAAAVTCPAGYVDTGVEGLPEIRTEIEVLPTRDSWQPGTLAVRVVDYFRGEAEPSNTSTIVFQPHGRLLSILSFRTVEAAEYLHQVADLQSDRIGEVEVSSGG